jgi:hypothetical protein
MNGLMGQVWRAVRPVGVYQRVLWWCGTLLLASAAVHGVVAAVDGSSWWGPVSWRKPVLFGLSLGLMQWSVVWLLRRLPQRWWTRVPAGLVLVSSMLEYPLIAMQRWRGVASHFNQATPFDAGVWSAIGTLILPLTLGVLWLAICPLIRFEGSAASRIAAVAGMLSVLVAGYIGSDMAAIGEATFDATGHVPAELLFGAAGSAKLAHATGLHGLQVLALLAIGLDLGRLRSRTAALAMLVGTLGFAACFGAITATAYAGRAPLAPTAPMAVLLGAGAVALVTVGLVALMHLPRPAGWVRAIPAGAHR